MFSKVRIHLIKYDKIHWITVKINKANTWVPTGHNLHYSTNIRKEKRKNGLFHVLSGFQKQINIEDCWEDFQASNSNYCICAYLSYFSPLFNYFFKFHYMQMLFFSHKNYFKLFLGEKQNSHFSTHSKYLPESLVYSWFPLKLHFE